MTGFWAMVKKELRSVTRERTIMIAIMIQLVIASFSSAILIGLLSFYDPDSITVNTRATVRVGLLGDTAGPLVSLLRQNHVRVTPFQNAAQAERAFQNHGVDAVMVVPTDTGGPQDLQMVLPRSETLSSLILTILKEPLKRYENTLRASRGVAVHYTDVQGLPSTTFEFLYAVLIPVLLFFPAFVAGSMVVDSISEEMENHTLETLWSAPVTLRAILGAKIAAALILAMIQCVAWLALLRLNQIQIENAGAVLLLAALVAAINALGSALTAIALRDRERSQFLYSLLILLALSATYFFDFSPVKLMMRLATADYYTGIADLVKYVVVLVVLFVVFFRASRYLVRV